MVGDGAMSAAVRARQLVAATVAWTLVACAAPAFAQVDFSGGWGARLHEDNLGARRWSRDERVRGTAHQRRGSDAGRQLERVPVDRARAPVHPAPADYGPNFSQLVMWKDVDPVTKDVVAWHTELSWMNPVRTIWMDGRPHPPALRASHLAGLLDREMGRRHADRRDHAI